MYRRVWVLAALLLGLVGCSHTQSRGQAADENDREDQDIKAVKTIGDVTDVAPLDGTPISGVALVAGLDGTGGGVPPGEYRKMLEDQLHKQGVPNVKELLASTDYTMVLVNSKIPVGIRKGDALDVEVTLPPQSKAISLRGGYLLECSLFDYQTTHNSQGGMGILKGHILAKARGRLLVDFGEGNEDIRLRRGRIWGNANSPADWEGALSNIDSPFFLYLKNDQQFASIANTIANRINSSFPDDAQKQYLVRQTKRLLVLDQVAGGINEKFYGSNELGRGEGAQAVGKEVVHVNVPLEYRLNPGRYLYVIRFIPLRESAESMGRYRKRLQEMLLEPKDTIRAALRLEALGKESIPALKKGLASDVTLVRFASAEALTYLGNITGVEELARLAEQHETLRGQCFVALASLNESITSSKLAELLRAQNPEVRVGAFRALIALTESAPQGSASFQIQGTLLNDAFWLQRVAPSSASMIHVSTRQRSEIVLFGEDSILAPPLRISAGSEFTITAEAHDECCTVNRYVVCAGKHYHKQCSFKVEDVLRTIAELGGQYPDAVEFLRQADHDKRLACAVLFDAQPSTLPVDVLAAYGSDASRLKDSPDFQQEVLAAQKELGMLPGRVVGTQR